MTYSVYYICSLLVNVLLTALYVVQVFTSHAACLSQTGNNITYHFEVAFYVGLVPLIAEILNSNIYAIYHRQKVEQEEKTFGSVSM